MRSREEGASLRFSGLAMYCFLFETDESEQKYTKVKPHKPETTVRARLIAMCHVPYAGLNRLIAFSSRRRDLWHGRGAVRPRPAPGVTW